jgi:hypothetical protein
VAAVLVAAAAAARAAAPSPVDWRGEVASVAARELAHHVTVRGDTAGRPFASVDKPQARVFVFDAGGRLAGAAPVLLGLAPGDDAVPFTGPVQQMPKAARTTPAGRFDSEPGVNDAGEAVVWIDYDASLALHRLRPGPAAERRRERLASARLADRRISLGCVVVDGGFFDRVVAPLLGRARGVVYVLPESRPWTSLFDG